MAGRKVNIVLTGIPELDKKLKTLQVKSATKISMATRRVGMSVVKRAIQKLVPVKIKEAIGSRLEKIRKSTQFEAKVGVNVGKRSKTKAKRWAPVIILGTPLRQRKMIGGKFAYITKPKPEQLSTGQIKANQAVRQGYAQSQGKARSAMKKRFDKAFAKERSRLQMKGK